MTKHLLRAELIQARDKLRRQIEILQSTATPIGIAGIPDNRSLIATLDDELREIEDALANLPPDGAG